MFTGIIEEVGTIKKILNIRKSLEITIDAKMIMEDIHLGDSIAVNGVCLTVTDFGEQYFSVCAVYETLKRSSMKNLVIGQNVNLERAMTSNGRFGGHIVYGHVDGIGKISEIKTLGNERLINITADDNILRYIVEKGSVAIDGISLTIAEINKNSFSVSVIPHTMENTILRCKSIGSTVNIENDYICKCIEKFVSRQTMNKSGITLDMLRSNGY